MSKSNLPDFIKQKIAERSEKKEEPHGKGNPKADDIASRHKERAKGINKSSGKAMKHPGPDKA